MTKLFFLLIFLSFNFNLFAQTTERCSTPTPPTQWDIIFNQMVEATEQNQSNDRTKFNNYIIPVIFHVLYDSQAIGTFPNLDQFQINSQIKVLNDDYAGVGYNSSKYVNYNGHPPFYDYAKANNLPYPDTGGVVIANTHIKFILATVDVNGNILPEAGIDRVSYSQKGWAKPTTFTTKTTFQNYINTIIKPNTIWDATKYLNVWLTDCSSAIGLLGFATFPNGSGLSGLSGVGTATTDGCWVWTRACGDTGIVSASYNKGRTLTHESGHYLGLRHVWGDATCATDYCNDIPQSKQANYANATYPFNMGTCPTGSYNNLLNGEMFMNFMDYSDDVAMWMFTNDQLTRMLTALANSPYRNNLTNSANSMPQTPNGIALPIQQTEFNIYPNPTFNNRINISVANSNSNGYEIVISNLVGQQVFTKKINEFDYNSINITLPSLNKGIYFVALINNASQKIVKKLLVE
ncbi:MAG: hypothetical protein RIQ33_1537 [Bacteroidota bacterium]|jgi:hypothetical protein